MLLILNNQGKSLGTCSGTVVHPAGYIVTNWHCVGHITREKFGERFHSLGLLGVAPTTDLLQPPSLTYMAQLLAGSPKFDLAVLKIIRPAAAGATLPINLPLRVTPLGDSDKVKIGESVQLFGYPGSGGQTVTYTAGVISGYTDWDRDGTPDSFKYDAKGGGGQSGGLAANSLGEQIAVHNSGFKDQDRDDRFGSGIFINLAKPLIEEAIAQGGSTVGPVANPRIPGSPPTTTVSPTPTPTRTPAPTPTTSTVVLRGLIIDADTKRPIPDAVLVLLREGVSFETYRAASAADRRGLFLAVGTTNAAGEFATEPEAGQRVQKGKEYTFIWAAKGYGLRDSELTIPANLTGDARLSRPLELKKL